MTYSLSALTMTSVTVSSLASAHALAASHSGCGTRTERAGVFGWFGMSGQPAGDGVVEVEREDLCAAVLAHPSGDGDGQLVFVERVLGEVFDLEDRGGVELGEAVAGDEHPDGAGDGGGGGHLGSLPGRCIYTLPRCMDTRQGFTRKEST